MIAGRERRHNPRTATPPKPAPHRTPTSGAPRSKTRDSSEALITADGVNLHYRYWSSEAHAGRGCTRPRLRRLLPPPRGRPPSPSAPGRRFDVVGLQLTRPRPLRRTIARSAILESYDVAAAVAGPNGPGSTPSWSGRPSARWLPCATPPVATANWPEWSASAPRPPRACPAPPPEPWPSAWPAPELGRQSPNTTSTSASPPPGSLRPSPPNSSPSIAVPVAIVQGDQDRYVPTTDAHAIYQACNPLHRRLDLVPGMGHAFDQKALPAVNRALDWVLAQHPTSTPKPNTEPATAHP